jgi:hypothetical protein
MRAEVPAYVPLTAAGTGWTEKMKEISEKPRPKIALLALLMEPHGPRSSTFGKVFVGHVGRKP